MINRDIKTIMDIVIRVAEAVKDILDIKDRK